MKQRSCGQFWLKIFVSFLSCHLSERLLWKLFVKWQTVGGPTTLVYHLLGSPGWSASVPHSAGQPFSSANWVTELCTRCRAVVTAVELSQRVGAKPATPGVVCHHWCFRACASTVTGSIWCVSCAWMPT